MYCSFRLLAVRIHFVDEYLHVIAVKLSVDGTTRSIYKF